jgi:chromosome segregation ATPase
MSQNANITWLDLTDTLMGDRSAKEFVSVITENKTLKHLLLESNRITDEAGVEIARALRLNSTLVTLSLKSNELSDESALVLMDVLSQNQLLSELVVDFNDFSYRAHVQLTEAITARKKALNAAIGDVAVRHIATLRVDEDHLTQMRTEVKELTETVETGGETRHIKEEELANLTATQERKITEANARLEEVRARYQEMTGLRDRRFYELSKERVEFEKEHSAVHNQFQILATKRQHAQARVRRAEAKVEKAEYDTHLLLDDLKGHLSTVTEQLRQLIEEAHAAQEEIAHQEAAEKAKEEALAKAEKQARREQKKLKPKVARGKSAVDDGRALSARRGSLAAQRPKTAAPQIVTPEFRED